MALKDLIPWNRERSVDVARRSEEPFWSLHRDMNRLFEDFVRGFDLTPAFGYEGFAPGRRPRDGRHGPRGGGDAWARREGFRALADAVCADASRCHALRRRQLHATQASIASGSSSVASPARNRTGRDRGRRRVLHAALLPADA